MTKIATPAKLKTATPRVVVTRNYLEKTDAKYIFRPLPPIPPPTVAAEVANLVLIDAKVESTHTDARFRVEQDFGCGLIFVGTKAPSEKVPANAQEIRYVRVDFRTVSGLRLVTGAKKVFFTKTGIFAVEPK